MKPRFFIGIDISKLTLDIAVIHGKEHIFQTKIDNNEKAIVSFLRLIKTDYGCTRLNSLYCAENMGIYSTYLLKVSLAKKLNICLENPLQIKRSIGLVRSKTDANDAMQIAIYTRKNFATLRLWKPQRPEIIKLKTLSTIRKKLLKLKVSITTAKKNENYYLTKTQIKNLRQYTQTTEAAILADLENIKVEMNKVITNDEKLSRLMSVITSVQCIGEVIASELIVCTNEFEESWTAKRFACYCGIAPFERTSGTSVKGKPRISGIANKEIKSLLHLAAVGTLRRKTSPLKIYYDRKVKEGKNKISVLNAIRNKLIHRVFSCVRNNILYVEFLPK